jgi:DNA-binding YbaB/EbfC family protein
MPIEGAWQKPALRAFETCQRYFDHALTGVAIEYRPFGPLVFLNRRPQMIDDLPISQATILRQRFSGLCHYSSFAFTKNDSYDARVTQFRTIIKPEARIAKMKFPGGLNIQGMMKQAQQMQEKMAREMEELRVDASAGGGVVNVTMKGDHEIISLKIDPEIVKENDIEMLQDMIVAAINEGNRKVNEAMKGKLGSMLPPGLGNLF